MKASKRSDSKIAVSLASFWKRLFAWIYDLLGAVAVAILAFVVGYLTLYVITLPWAENAQQLSTWLSESLLWPIYLLLCVQYYYVWCWVKGGQTVGMRAWRLKLCKPDGESLSWKEAYIRSFSSLAGISTVWALIDDEKRGIQDLVVDSRVVLLPKNFNQESKPLI